MKTIELKATLTTCDVEEDMTEEMAKNLFIAEMIEFGPIDVSITFIEKEE